MGKILFSDQNIFLLRRLHGDILLTNPGNPQSLPGFKNDTMLQIICTFTFPDRVKPITVLDLTEFLKNVKIFPIS